MDIQLLLQLRAGLNRTYLQGGSNRLKITFYEFAKNLISVIPAKAGIQKSLKRLDSRSGRE